jgi:hypothetical protein
MGVWIDSREAVVVDAETERAGEAGGIRRITTDLERQLRLSSGRRAETSYGPQTAPSDDMRETSSRENLRGFFDEVAAALRDARSIFIFGPGEAKGEFRKRLERDGLGGRIDGVETAGRLSERQIAAKVREHFRPRDRNGEGGNTMRSEKTRSGMHALDGRPTAQKKSAMLRRLVTEFPTGPATAAVAVDFPRDGERVVSREYAFRVSAEAQGHVEVSIDDGAWRPCRQAAGHWWCDWSGYGAGAHTVFARVTVHKRRRILSERRDFSVEFA